MSRFTRRNFLRGTLGATLALPAFASMGPRASAQEASPRFLVYFLPNGRRPEHWVPTIVDGDLRFPAGSPLQRHASRCLAIDALDNIAARESPGAAHAMGTGTCMTSTRIMNDELRSPSNNISVDQLIAGTVGGGGVSSLQWAAGEPGPCDVGGSSCAYTQSISWSGVGRNLGPTIDPASAFERLFGTNVEGRTGELAEIRRRTRRSVLDFVQEDATRLRGVLSTDDQRSLEQYFESVRELERGFETDTTGCMVDGDIARALPYAERVEAFNRLIELAFRCDVTRVISFMIEFGLSSRSHDFLDAPGNHHALSHYGSTEQRNRLDIVERWQGEQLANLLDRLANTRDAMDRPLLDETAVVVVPSMGIGASHNHGRLAPLVFGGTRLFQTDGRLLHFGAGSEALLADFHVALLRAYGLDGTYGRNGAVFGDYGTSALSGVVR